MNTVYRYSLCLTDFAQLGIYTVFGQDSILHCILSQSQSLFIYTCRFWISLVDLSQLSRFLLSLPVRSSSDLVPGQNTEISTGHAM